MSFQSHERGPPQGRKRRYPKTTDLKTLTHWTAIYFGFAIIQTKYVQCSESKGMNTGESAKKYSSHLKGPKTLKNLPLSVNARYQQKRITSCTKAPKLHFAIVSPPKKRRAAAAAAATGSGRLESPRPHKAAGYRIKLVFTPPSIHSWINKELCVRAKRCPTSAVTYNLKLHDAPPDNLPDYPVQS